MSLCVFSLLPLSTAAAFILQGVGIVAFGFFGVGIAVAPTNKRAIVYAVLVFIMGGVSIFSYIRANRLANSFADAMSENWGDISEQNQLRIEQFVRKSGILKCY